MCLAAVQRESRPTSAANAPTCAGPRSRCCLKRSSPAHPIRTKADSARRARLDRSWSAHGRTPIRRRRLRSPMLIRRRRSSPPQNGTHGGRLRGPRCHAPRTEPGSPPRSAATRSTCSRSRGERDCRSWSRFATGACWCRRSRSFAAPPTSWRPTLRTAHEQVFTRSCAATRICRTLGSSPPRIVALCSASTISTRHCRDRSSGTSSGWRRASP